MKLEEFQKMKEEFKGADIDKKIELYISAEDLTRTQYRELLLLFPRSELGRLEKALG